MHESVLLQEVLEGFREVHLATFVDGTLGAGGHSRAILAAHPEIERFIGFDQDPTALKLAQSHLHFPSAQFIPRNFVEIDHFVAQADGILVDLGVSSMQLDQAEKGFSFRREGPLDMRMDPSNPTTAALLVNTLSEKELGYIFHMYGEERRWRKAAGAIIKARSHKPLTTTRELAALLETVLYDPKSKIHPATRIFQALRLAVNQELECLERFLPSAFKLLNPGGRLAVISFHSLEDRLVKHFFRTQVSDKVSTSGLGGLFLDKKPEGRLITTKPIEASEEEVAKNPRSRSAKLRIIEKLA